MDQGVSDAFEIVAFRRIEGDVAIQLFLDGRRATVGELNAVG